jgi:TadE-like protein
MSAKQTGQALVEFALILPMLIVLLLGGADLLMALSAHQIISYAAEQTAQCVSLGPTLCGLASNPDPAAYVDRITAGLGLPQNPPDSPPTVTSYTPFPCIANCRVTVEYTYRPLFHFFPQVPMSVTASATPILPSPPAGGG